MEETFKTYFHALNFIFRILFPSIKYIRINSWMFLVGLKRKFSFSYFRKNFAKIYHFSQNNRTKIYENNKNFREHWCENFRENENFYEHLCNNFTFWYNHILSRLFHNFLAEIFATIFAKSKIDAKMFAKTKIFAKQNFANFTKITSLSHDFRFSRKWKNSFLFQP
jgi:dolichol kinase